MQEVSERARGKGAFWGVLEGEKVRGVCALGAVREGRAPQCATVEVHTRGGGRWWSGRAGWSHSGDGWGHGPRRRMRSTPARQASGGWG